MKVLRNIEEARAACRQVRFNGKRLALVPTMGALHEGHLALVRAARTHGNVVAVSVFVNPLQFGPQEDFGRYPRDFNRDSKLLEAAQADFVFAPAVEEMYPGNGPGIATAVEVAGLSQKLEGKTRPGHFRGVTTVVSKLFHIIEPDAAYFGQKDIQQTVVLRRMARDLDMPVEIVVCPTVREKDGLAMSSRNRYLDPRERQAATVLYRSLMRAQTLADTGEHSASVLAGAGREVVAEEPLARLDYFEVVHPETLDPLTDISQGALVVAAAYIGNTRLIDNIQLHGAGQASRSSRSMRAQLLA